MRYDAVAFLRGLFNPVPDMTPDDLPPEWRDIYRERAAIREISGGLPRELAEHYALLDTLELMQTWHLYPTY
jgi:hypothetical protein